MEKWNKGSELPTESGCYKVKNDSGCNGSFGEVEFIVGKGWQIPECIKSFYKIRAWNTRLPSHNSEYMSALEDIIREGVENKYAVQEIVLAVQRLNQRS